MTEAVGAGGLCLGDERTVGIMHALGDRDEALAVALVDVNHVVHEVVHVEVRLGQVDQVGTLAAQIGKRGGGSQPAGVSAHALDNGNHALVVNVAVAGDFHDRGGDVLRCGGKAGAVIGAEQVVVDGLGNAEHAALVADLLHVAVDLVAGIHRVVAAVIEEIADVVFFENLENALIVGFVGLGIGDLIAAGAEGGGGRVEQAFQLCGVLLIHHHQAVVEDADDAVKRAVDLGDVLALQRGLDDAVGAGVDNGGGTAGLTDDRSSLKRFFCTHLYSSMFLCRLARISGTVYHTGDRFASVRREFRTPHRIFVAFCLIVCYHTKVGASRQ